MKKSNDYLYEVVKNNDGTYAEIVKYTGRNSIVEIPEKLGSLFKHKVAAIRNGAFADNETLKKVVIPDGVKRIGEPFQDSISKVFNPLMPMLDSAKQSEVHHKIKRLENNTGVFNKCLNLEEIIILEGCKSIGYSAFGCCYSLKTINLPNSTTKIEKQAFWACGIKSFTFPPNLTEVGDEIFGRCGSLEEAHLHNNITLIEGGAFADCYMLHTINIPTSVKTIGFWAFARCNALKNISIPSDTIVHESAFVECPAEIIHL